MELNILEAGMELNISEAGMELRLLREMHLMIEDGRDSTQRNQPQGLLSEVESKQTKS